MSSRPAAPSRASMTACVRTSASEWPASPSSCGMSTPPRMSGRPGSNRWLSTPMPVRITWSPDGLQAPLAPLEDAQLGDPDLAQQLDRLVVAEAEVVGGVGVAGQGDRAARLDDQLEEAAGGVDLADRLAQAGGGDLDRDAGLRERLDGRLVVAAQVALGRRAAAAPDLDEVRVGHDVVHAR